MSSQLKLCGMWIGTGGCGKHNGVAKMQKKDVYCTWLCLHLNICIVLILINDEIY